MTFYPFRRLSDALRVFWVGLMLITGVPVQAQFRVEVTGVGLTQLPIAVSAFRGEDGAPQKIATIVQADLERSGVFRIELQHFRKGAESLLELRQFERGFRLSQVKVLVL